KGVADAQSSFGALADEHARTATRWFWSFTVASVIVLLAVLWAAATPTLAGSVPLVTAGIFRKLLVISASAAFLRLCLGKYNAERNLKIIYEHRSAVLSQYRVFESAIGDDLEGRTAKNQLRIEIAKYIFNDPATGYVSSDAAADINISPVIGTVERFLPK
ncbi:MAG TPA: hypothetical protein VN605_14675, partial [Thermoanaerobaculia bacterium]|nr:hypothetical protein [Thermoanaerobaculia bacterium]